MNCFGIPDEYAGFAIHQGPDDRFYASIRAETWDDLRERIDYEFAADAVPAGDVEPCSFADCPPGLFRWNGLLCFKSEYSTKAGQPDAYCVDSGEYFWGGTSGDLEKRRKLMVQPIASAALSHGEGRK